VQTQIAERLMVLAGNSDATAEIRAAALTGVRKTQDTIGNIGARTPAFQQIDHEITQFLQNPEQNTPKIKPSAPPGPPV